MFWRSDYCYFDKEYKNIFAYNQIDKVYDNNKQNILLGDDNKNEFDICETALKCYKFLPVRISDKIYIHLVVKKD